jgi:hypothetical protein
MRVITRILGSTGKTMILGRRAELVSYTHAYYSDIKHV